MTPDQVRLLNTVEFHLQSGRPGEAQQVLDTIAPQFADAPRAWWARALIAQAQGDLLSAEGALRRTAEVDPVNPFAHNALGELMASQGRTPEALAAWRAALGRDPRFAPAALNLAEAQIAGGDADAALKTLGPLPRDPAILTQRAIAYGELGRTEESLTAYRAAASASWGATGTIRNLTAALLAAGQLSEAESEARKALRSAPESADLWQILGEALAGQDRAAEAEAAFRDGLARDSRHPGCQRDLAHLIWAGTGDVAAATATLDQALAEAPGQYLLMVIKAKVLEVSGDAEAARALLAAPAGQEGAPNYLRCAAAQLLVHSDPVQAVTLASRAVATAPRDPFGLSVLAEAQLAAGDPNGALATVGRLREVAPLDQHGLALEATAWRMLGDPRYAERYDYDLVRAAVIDPPAGWPDLDSYLADLARALEALHGTAAHPVGQSVRGGTQTTARLEDSQDPAIQAFLTAIDAPIRAYIAGLGKGSDPLRARMAKAYRLSGCWSVRLAAAGHHVDHLHNNGWISSAFYVRLPASVLAEGRQGSLRFGHPGVPTQPPLAAEHWVKPQPGMLALFPSYMWHGTEAFEGDETRLTIAFDVIPA